MMHTNVATRERVPIDSVGANRSISKWPAYCQPESQKEPKDHFIKRDGLECAGSHLIIDLWGAQHLDNLDVMEETFRKAVEAAGATLLHIHLHHFTPEGGISGVAVLAESHISVHTWPERQFAAFDIFMCGESEPRKALEIITRNLNPERVTVHEHLRGAVEHDEAVC
ncbi:MAG: adenosylmethionine decarboxylase [Desulfobacterales bacterium]|nr:adenosylmethionine decarboxylase [Desulfobacterales bacterium]